MRGEAEQIYLVAGAELPLRLKTPMTLPAIRLTREPGLRSALSAGGIAAAPRNSRPVLAERMLGILERVAARGRS
jgi:hypothetical protein